MRKFTREVKSLMLGASMICVALLMPSCIDDNYNLDKISSEVTIGGEEVVVPIGSFGPVTLSDLLGEGLEGLEQDNGSYVLKFEDEGQSFTVEGISLPVLSGLAPKIDRFTFQTPSLPTDFMFDEIKTSFELGYPDLDVTPAFNPVEFSAGINLDFGIKLPEGMTIPALGKLSFADEGSVPFKASFDMPEQIRSIGKIYLGKNKSSFGSMIEVALEFKGIKSINGGGKLNLEAVFPANYMLANERGELIGNKLKIENYAVAAGVESFKIKAYLYSIDFSQRSISRGVMNINDTISYKFDYQFESVQGYCNASNLPQFCVTIAPEFRDMEVVTNKIVVDDTDHSSEIVYTLSGLPESVKSIDYVAFSSAPISLRIDGLSWLKSDALYVETQLPECFVFDTDPNGYLNTSTNKLRASVAQFAKGVSLNLKAIDLTKGGAEIKSGQLVIETSISSHVSDIQAGSTFMLSEMLPPTSPVKITTILEEAHFYLDLAKCHVELNEQYYDFKFDESQIPSFEYSVDVPDELAAVDRLELSTPKGDDVKVRLGISRPKNKVFPVDKVYLSLTVNLKKLIHPVDGQSAVETAANGDKILRIDRKEWYPNRDPYLELVEVAIDAIENLPEITGEKGARKININEKIAVTGGVAIDAGTNINLASENVSLDFDFEIDDAQVSKFYGKIDYSFEPENLPEIELGEMAGSGLKIENLDISPIIRFNITNPIDLPFLVSLALNPFDAEGSPMADNRVEIEDVRIAGEGRTQIVLATKDRRDEFAGQKEITFVETDLAKLFKGSLPSKVAVDMKVNTDLSTTHVIDLSKSSYEIGYDYSVVLPLEFGHDFDITFEQDIEMPEFLPTDEGVESGAGVASGDSSLLSMIEVGDVALIADFATTIPLDFVLNAECLDKDGRPAAAQIRFGENNNMIHGHHPEDAEPEVHSTLELLFDLGESGKFETLNDIAVLRLRLNLRNNSETTSALSPDQSLEGKFRLRLRDGITIDLEGLLTE